MIRVDRGDHSDLWPRERPHTKVFFSRQKSPATHLNMIFRKCEFDDRDNAPKHCIGKEFDKRPCKGPPCRPFWDYSEWDKCDCLSLKTHRKRICKRITSKDTADILPDRDCYGLTSEPLEKNCVGPEVS